MKTSWSFVPDPPANDAFAVGAAGSLEEGVIGGRTTAATKEPGEPSHAGNAGGHSVWYRWVAPADGLAVIDTYDFRLRLGERHRFDTLLAVYRGSSLALARARRRERRHDAALRRSRVSSRTAGEEFAIAVDGSDGESGGFALNWTIAPPNDDFARAAVLSGCRGTTLGTTFRSTWEDAPSERDDPADVWYLWRAPQSGLVEFTMEASSYYSGFSVWSGPTPGRSSRFRPPAFAAAVSSPGNGRPFRERSTASRYVGDAFGGFTLSWGPTMIPPPPVTPRPPNDDFAAATMLSRRVGRGHRDNEGATLEDEEPEHNDEFLRRPRSGIAGPRRSPGRSTRPDASDFTTSSRSTAATVWGTCGGLRPVSARR